MNVFGKMACGVALATLCGAAQATTIDFDFNGGVTYSSLFEDGFEVTNGPRIAEFGPTTITSWGGNRSDDNVLMVHDYGGNQSDEVLFFDVTREKDFLFSSFDGVSMGWSQLLVTGFDDGVEVYKLTYEITFGYDSQVGYVERTYNGMEGAVDKLTFSGPAGSGGGLYLDRIVLDEVAAVVPEPSTWALMLAGFGMTGAALRRRRQRVAVLA